MKVLIFKPCLGFHHSFPEVKCIKIINHNQSVMLPICFLQCFLPKIDSCLLSCIPGITHINIKILVWYLLMDVPLLLKAPPQAEFRTWLIPPFTHFKNTFGAHLLNLPSGIKWVVEVLCGEAAWEPVSVGTKESKSVSHPSPFTHSQPQLSPPAT